MSCCKVILDNTIQIMIRDQEFAKGRKRFKSFYTCFRLLREVLEMVVGPC